MFQFELSLFFEQAGDDFRSGSIRLEHSFDVREPGDGHREIGRSVQH